MPAKNSAALSSSVWLGLIGLCAKCDRGRLGGWNAEPIPIIELPTNLPYEVDDLQTCHVRHCVESSSSSTPRFSTIGTGPRATTISVVSIADHAKSHHLQ